jgi:hypothetical protein
MTRYCITCGASLADGARFCAGCGSAVAPALDQHAAQQSASEPLAESNMPQVEAQNFAASKYPLDENEASPAFEEPAFEDDIRKGPNWLLIGGGAAILLLLLLYYLIFIRDDLPSNPAVSAPVAKEEVKAEEEESKQFFAVADANIRDRPTAQGTNILGQLLRGTAASGTLINGEDGTSEWLKLADDKGFVGLVNLSDTKPPILAKLLGDKKWTADKDIEILTQPDPSSTVVDRVASGAVLTLYGLTANDYIEIKLRKGGVGYIVGGARILAATPVTGKPITISFNPATCNFGGELEAEFERLSKRVRAAYDATEKADYPTDAARDKALAALEGKSSYQKLQRSFNGLSITAIGQHYESQSVYFADPSEKVASVFRASGQKVGKDGRIPSADLIASIGASGGEGRSFGKSELGCGV